MHPGEVLCSLLRTGAEPCIVLSASSHYCHRADCVAFGFILLLRSTVICFGCKRDGQLPCLLSAPSDNLCKGKSHWIPPPSLIGEKDLEKMVSRDKRSSLGVLLLCSQRRTSRVCRWVPDFSHPPCRHLHHFPSRQLSSQCNSIACRVVLASAVMMPEMLREVMDHSSPLIYML